MLGSEVERLHSLSHARQLTSRNLCINSDPLFEVRKHRVISFSPYIKQRVKLFLERAVTVAEKCSQFQRTKILSMRHKKCLQYSALQDLGVSIAILQI